MPTQCSKCPRVPMSTLPSQQDQVVRRRNARFAGRLLGLPPSTADIRHFKDLMFLETDLVVIFGTGVVRVDGSSFVWILGGCGRFLIRCRHGAEVGRNGIPKGAWGRVWTVER